MATNGAKDGVEAEFGWSCEVGGARRAMARRRGYSLL